MMNDLSPRAVPFRAVLAAQKTIYRELLWARMPEWIHLDLSMGQLKTLVLLASDRAMNVSALADTLGVSKPTASILVDQLVQKEFVQRTEDSEDRRRTLVAPTLAGSNLVAQLRQGGPEDRMLRWLEALAPDDLAALMRGLQALAAVAERDAAQSRSASGEP